MAKPKKKRKPQRTATPKEEPSEDASGVEEPTESDSTSAEDRASSEGESTAEAEAALQEPSKPAPANKAHKSARDRQPVPENIPTRPAEGGKGAGGLIFVGVIFGLLLFAVVVQMMVGQ